MNEVQVNKSKNQEISSCIDNIEKHRLQKDVIRLRKTMCITLICFLFCIVILIGGILANSLLIISESVYIFSYFSELFISLLAVGVGNKPSTKVFTFGYQRAEVIVKLVSVISIWLISAFIIKEDLDRINIQSSIDPKIMLFTSIFGFFCNLILIYLLKDINCKYSQEKHYEQDHIHCTNPVNNNKNEQKLCIKDKNEISLTMNSCNEKNKEKRIYLLIYRR